MRETVKDKSHMGVWGKEMRERERGGRKERRKGEGDGRREELGHDVRETVKEKEGTSYVGCLGGKEMSYREETSEGRKERSWWREIKDFGHDLRKKK